MAKENKSTESADKIQTIIDQVSELSVLELAELVKALEEKFGVSAAPVAVAGVVATAPAAAEAAEEKSAYDVVLVDAGSNKIGVIKALREINSNLGLVEAKTIAESAPKTILEAAKKEDAELAKKKLEDAGAKVELK